MRIIFIILFFISFYNLSSGQHNHSGYGIIKIKFEDENSNYRTFDSIYGIELRSRLIDYCNRNTLYPQEVSDNCEEGTVLIGFRINTDDYSCDTASIKIISGVNSSLDNEAIKVVRGMPKFTKQYSYRQNISDKRLVFALSFSFKLIDCADSLWRKDTFPENGYYTGYYKRGNRKRIEGSFKKGKPDSLWIFYDTTGNVIKKGYCKTFGKNYPSIRPVPIENDLSGFPGIKNGIWNEYDSNGNLMSKNNYIYGVLNGPQICYYKSGEIHQIQVYRDGFSFYTIDYYDNGLVHWTRESAYNPKYRSTETEYTYYPNGIVKVYRIENTIGDKSESMIKEYYENGNIKCSKEYVNDKLHGHEQNYDINGNLK